jgi:hypothetical protein
MEEYVKTINLFLFQFVIAVFFIVLGIMGVLPNIDEGVFSLRGLQWEVELVAGILEVLCGVLLLFGLFASPSRGVLRNASFAVFVFWVARIAYTRFLVPGVLSTAVSSLETFLPWLLLLSVELVVLLSVWLIARRYGD